MGHKFSLASISVNHTASASQSLPWEGLSHPNLLLNLMYFILASSCTLESSSG
ncbi:hypothetical protein DSO57_1002830, partial [Entomophthora muscae]